MAHPDRDLISAVGLLLEAANYLERAVAADVQNRTGLPGPWFETLVRLRRSPASGVRMNEMAAQVSFAPSSFSRLVDNMEAEGLVERTPDPTNRRATLLRLATSGEQRVSDAIRVHEPSARRHFADLLSDDELDVLETITRKIRDANQPGSVIAPTNTPDFALAERRGSGSKGRR